MPVAGLNITLNSIVKDNANNRYRLDLSGTWNANPIQYSDGRGITDLTQRLYASHPNVNGGALQLVGTISTGTEITSLSNHVAYLEYGTFPSALNLQDNESSLTWYLRRKGVDTADSQLSPPRSDPE